jgi:hypothetical protein
LKRFRKDFQVFVKLQEKCGKKVISVEKRIGVSGRRMIRSEKRHLRNLRLSRESFLSMTKGLLALN